MVREPLSLEGLQLMPPGEAAAYFVTRRAEGLTDQERELLDRWLAADEQHAEALHRAESAWAVFEEAEDDEVLRAMRAHARAPRRRNKTPVWGPLAAAAAAVLLLVGGALWLGTNWRPPIAPGPSQTVQTAAYVTSRGEVKEVKLADGSVMTLDAESSAVAGLSANERAVELRRGRAFFVVAGDSSRPFTVTAGDRRIVALGTRFDVNLAAGVLTVTLAEGALSVGPAGAAAPTHKLAAGQQLIARGADVSVRNVGPGAQQADAWRTGMLEFDDQPLAEAVAVMNRYSQDQIVINSPKVAELKISGQFRAGAAERFAATVAELHGLKTARKGNAVELLPPG